MIFLLLIIGLQTGFARGDDCEITVDGQLSVTDQDGKAVEVENDREPLTLDNGKTYNFKCSISGYQFVNGVRRIKGVVVYNLDQGSGVDVKCDEGVVSPDIATDLNGDKRFLFCDEGCSPFREDLYAATYPASIVTSEENSPPITHNNFMSVALACQPGYTRSAGNVGKTSILCEKDADTGAVAWSTSNVIDCISGCQDITQEVTNGITTDRASTTVGTAPFTPGDTVTFTCNTGYQLTGYRTLTCTGANIWNEQLPECIFIQPQED